MLEFFFYVLCFADSLVMFLLLSSGLKYASLGSFKLCKKKTLLRIEKRKIERTERLKGRDRERETEKSDREIQRETEKVTERYRERERERHGDM